MVLLANSSVTINYNNSLLFCLAYYSNRTCQTRNNYASDNCSIDIVVNVPPKWIFEPKNAQVILSKSITINCQAEGFPKPKIVWKKAIANSITNDIALDDKLVNLQPTEYRDISSSYRYQVFSNGSLYLQETEINDGGFYMCQVCVDRYQLSITLN